MFSQKSRDGTAAREFGRGLGSAVSEYMAESRLHGRIYGHGEPEGFKQISKSERYLLRSYSQRVRREISERPSELSAARGGASSHVSRPAPRHSHTARASRPITDQRGNDNRKDHNSRQIEIRVSYPVLLATD